MADGGQKTLIKVNNKRIISIGSPHLMIVTELTYYSCKYDNHKLDHHMTDSILQLLFGIVIKQRAMISK